MILIEDVRKSLIGTFQAAQEAEYPTMKVNYPNFVVVDLEKQRDPFISVEIAFGNNPQAAHGEREIFVSGFLNVYYYFREGGGGTSNAYVYADFLNRDIGMKGVDSIHYDAVRIIPVKTFPDWTGRLNSIGFQVVETVSC